MNMLISVCSEEQRLSLLFLTVIIFHLLEQLLHRDLLEEFSQGHGRNKEKNTQYERCNCKRFKPY